MNGFDYGHSAAILIGTATYTYLPSVPAVASSLERMHRLLTGPLCGWPRDKVRVLADERVPGNLPDLLVEDFSAARDVALFYYVGHGQPDRNDRLCLGLVDSRTDQERRYTTSLTFDAVRHAMQESKAKVKILLLDCCYSGLALSGHNTLGADDGFGISGRVIGSGAYVVAACGPYDKARYEEQPGNPDAGTYFTKHLVEVVLAGGAGGATVLTLGQLTSKLREDLASLGRPVPAELARDEAAAFPFARYTATPAPVPPEPLPSEPAAPEQAPPQPLPERDDDLPAPITYVPEPVSPGPAASRYPDVPVAVWREPDIERRTLTLVRTAISLAETDSAQARRVFSAAEQAAHSEPDAYLRFHLLVKAAQQSRRPARSQAQRFLGLAMTCARALEDQPLSYQSALKTLREVHASLRRLLAVVNSSCCRAGP